MKTKIIPFDLETAKKIQAGEIEGKIKTREGNDARIICWDKKSEFPIVSLSSTASGGERIETHLLNGGAGRTFITDGDLFLEVPDDEPQFKPFDRVLVRDSDNEEWICAIFSHTRYIQSRLYVRSTNGYNLQCIPYEGNEQLVGTADKPKEE